MRKFFYFIIFGSVILSSFVIEGCSTFFVNKCEKNREISAKVDKSATIDEKEARMLSQAFMSEKDPRILLDTVKIYHKGKFWGVDFKANIDGISQGITSLTIDKKTGKIEWDTKIYKMLKKSKISEEKITQATLDHIIADYKNFIKQSDSFEKPLPKILLIGQILKKDRSTFSTKNKVLKSWIYYKDNKLKESDIKEAQKYQNLDKETSLEDRYFKIGRAEFYIYLKNDEYFVEIGTAWGPLFGSGWSYRAVQDESGKIVLKFPIFLWIS